MPEIDSKDKLFEILVLEKVQMPERSRLPQLVPVGVGTPMVESLTSYISRQALAHSVSSATLIKEGLAVDQKTFDTSWYNTYSPIINGVGEAASNFIRATEESTQLSGMESLTLRPFKDVLPAQGLLRDRLRWCPECYSEWLSEGKPVYSPLIWHLKAVRICPVHKKLLCDWCPSCCGIIPVIPRRLFNGSCPYCETSLGLRSKQQEKADDISQEISEWETWVVDTMGDLLANSKDYSSNMKKQNISGWLRKYQDKYFCGKTKGLARHFGIPVITVRGWIRGETRPVLEEELRLCYNAGIHPKTLFLAEEIPELPIPFKKVAKPKKEINKLKKVNLFNKSFLEKDLQNRLETLREEPFSVREIASQIGLSKRTLYRHFPGLCKCISAKYLSYKQKMATEKLEKRRAEVHGLIEKLLKCGLYPTRSNLEKEIITPWIIRDFSITKELDSIDLKRWGIKDIESLKKTRDTSFFKKGEKPLSEAPQDSPLGNDDETDTE